MQSLSQFRPASTFSSRYWCWNYLKLEVSSRWSHWLRCVPDRPALPHGLIYTSIFRIIFCCFGARPRGCCVRMHGWRSMNGDLRRQSMRRSANIWRRDAPSEIYLHRLWIIAPTPASSGPKKGRSTPVQPADETIIIIFTLHWHSRYFLLFFCAFSLPRHYSKTWCSW